MKLYHGTTASLLSAVLQKGLMPRGKRKSNWDEAPSNPRCVYLTDAYAPYFCFHEGKTGLVVEIETERIDQAKLLPDEDVLEQTSRRTGEVSGTTLERTAYYRNRMHLYSHEQWRQSLKAMGTCAHLGKIPIAAVTRVAVIPFQYFWFWDASISLINYKLVGSRYRAQMARLFGDPIPDMEVQGLEGHNAGTWQFPMSGHKVWQVQDGRLQGEQSLSAPDERVMWHNLMKLLMKLPKPEQQEV